MQLHSPICGIFGIRYPIFLAGMGDASGPALVAAVSNAGGLGVLGAAACPADELNEWIRQTREMTDKPFGVDTLLPASVWRQNGAAKKKSPSASADNEYVSPAELLPQYQALAQDFMREMKLEEHAPPAARTPDKKRRFSLSKSFFEEQMEAVIEQKVPVYAAGLGNPAPWMTRLRANGTRVMAVVGAVRHAVQVAAAGVDAIVAQGHDAGGHNSPVGTMALIPQVVDAAGSIPILAAGGITDGRGIAAGMMLGAQGAWVGSAFLASDEALIPDYMKQAILDATEEGTVISRSVTGKPARLIRSQWTDFWQKRNLEPLPMPLQSAVSGPVLSAAHRDGRADIHSGFAGQGIGMIKAVRPAAEIFADLVAGAEKSLSASASFLSED